MENINNDNESIRKEGIRLFKLHCRDMGIKADKETYLEWKEEAKENGYANLAEYIKSLRGENKPDNDYIPHASVNIVDVLKRRARIFIKVWIATIIFGLLDVIFILLLPLPSNLIVAGIIGFIVGILGIVALVYIILILINIFKLKS